jgi:hypothetical protein
VSIGCAAKGELDEARPGNERLTKDLKDARRERDTLKAHFAPSKRRAPRRRNTSPTVLRRWRSRS